jgi:hypothetical protein
MKKFLITLVCSTLGSIFGAYIYALIQGPATEYRWGPTIFFGLFFGSISFFLTRRNQRRSGNR